MLTFLKKYSKLIKIYVILIVVLNLLLIGMYFRFKKELTIYKNGMNLIKQTVNKNKKKNKRKRSGNINITIEEI